jgi:transposase
VPRPEQFELRTERLGPLPIVNHFLERLGLEEIFRRFVPTDDLRYLLGHEKALGVLLRSIIVEREPIYRQQETVNTFAPECFGLLPTEVTAIGDDRIGRALDHLFDADRGALLTEIVIAMVREFSVTFDEVHNDSTTIRFCGQYRAARGRSIRGKRGPWITYGNSKDHRPDLKQLLFVLTSTADGGVPVQFRCGDGNTNDAKTHIETWEALRKIAGMVAFLYVADCKLCTRENMDYIAERGGRFVTVMPRNRLEDSEFREWIQTNQPSWELVWDRPNPRRKHSPRNRWWVFQYPIPSREGWPVIWVYSSLLALRQEQTRREHIARAVEELTDLNARLKNPRTRLRKPAEVERRIEEILRPAGVSAYLRVQKRIEEEYTFRQKTSGRPGPNTEYSRKTKHRYQVAWQIDESAIAYDRKSDGMYPLLTNDRSLTPRQVLEAHKGQPRIEKRFEQTKTVHEIAPVFLKNEGRVEALFFLYFVGLLVQALVERELRRAMAREGIEELPLYPEERLCRRPTTEQVFKLFSLAERHLLYKEQQCVQVFDVQITELQRQLLSLLGVPPRAFMSPR